MTLQAVVLCGGLGTRMAAHAPDLPKVLLPVAGRPFIRHLLERLDASGFDEVVLCIGHRGAVVREALAEADPSRPPRISFSDEGELRLGTAGALRHAAHLLDETFLVTYGDSYLTFDYAAPLRLLRAEPSALGCMAVYANDDRIEPSNTAVKEGWVVRYDKTRRSEPGPKLDHIDYGATALRRVVLDEIPEGATRGLDAIQASLAQRRVLLAASAPERFYEIGSPEGLAALERRLSMARGGVV